MSGSDVSSQSQAVDQAASRLRQAAATRTPCAPVRDLLGTVDIESAYAVQERLIEEHRLAGARLIGRKIGLTSPAVQAQIGVDRPDFGALLDDMLISAGEAVPSERLLQPKAEAEIAFVLKDTLDAHQMDVEDVRAAVDYALAAIEIVDSRVVGWDIAITDTIADNASSGLFVLGDLRVPLTEFEPADVTMTLFKDGALSSSGDGRACLGDPLNALLWLAQTTRDHGAPLIAGDIVLSGALGAMIDVEPGSTIEAHISSLGSVTARFSLARL